MLRAATPALLLCVVSVLAHADDGPPTSDPGPPASHDRDPRCRHAADPLRRPRECNDQAFDWDETLAGGFDKLRETLQNMGMTPTMSYTGALQTGAGPDVGAAWSYAGQLSAALLVDLGKMLGPRGLSFYVSASWGTGGDLTATLQDRIPTSTLYAPSYYLGEMYLQQRLAGERLTLQIGRLAASDGFAALPVFSAYVTSGINPTPFSLVANDPAFSSQPPGTEWGVQASYKVSAALQISTAVFNTNASSANGTSHGADLTLQQGDHGALSIAQVDYQVNQAADTTGHPGEFVLGVLHSSNALPRLDDPAVRGGGYSGLYLMGQQMIYEPDGVGTRRGATLWAAATLSSDRAVSSVPVFWAMGASYEGPCVARPADILSTTFIRAGSSSYAVTQSPEEVLELNYQWVHSRYLVITPHLQYLWEHPRDAVVIGVQAALTL